MKCKGKIIFSGELFKLEDPVKYADDKTLYLSATKKYYSSSHPNGHHSYH